MTGLRLGYACINTQLPSVPKAARLADLTTCSTTGWHRRSCRLGALFHAGAGKRPAAHAETIDLDAFDRFLDEVGDLPLACILEVKGQGGVRAATGSAEASAEERRATLLSGM